MKYHGSSSDGGLSKYANGVFKFIWNAQPSNEDNTC
jgi:hypothetical protein